MSAVDPRTLNKDQKQKVLLLHMSSLSCCNGMKRDTFDQIVTSDDTWIHYYDPELKSQTMEWHKSVVNLHQKYFALKLPQKKSFPHVILFNRYKDCVSRK